jgi:hypothetical protein
MTVLYLPETSEFDTESLGIPHDIICNILKVNEIELKNDRYSKKKIS